LNKILEQSVALYTNLNLNYPKVSMTVSSLDNLYFLYSITMIYDMIHSMIYTTSHSFNCVALYFIFSLFIFLLMSCLNKHALVLLILLTKPAGLSLLFAMILSSRFVTSFDTSLYPKTELRNNYLQINMLLT